MAANSRAHQPERIPSCPIKIRRSLLSSGREFAGPISGGGAFDRMAHSVSPLINKVAIRGDGVLATALFLSYQVNVVLTIEYNSILLWVYPRLTIQISKLCAFFRRMPGRQI